MLYPSISDKAVTLHPWFCLHKMGTEKKGKEEKKLGESVIWEEEDGRGEKVKNKECRGNVKESDD